MGTPVNVLLYSQKCQDVPFFQSVKIHYFCSGPISVDPICPQPNVHLRVKLNTTSPSVSLLYAPVNIEPDEDTHITRTEGRDRVGGVSPQRTTEFLLYTARTISSFCVFAAEGAAAAATGTEVDHARAWKRVCARSFHFRRYPQLCYIMLYYVILSYIILYYVILVYYSIL